MKKRILICLTVVTMLVNLFSINAFALSLPEIYSNNINLKSNTTVKIPVYIKNNSNIMGWKLNFDYNNMYLTPDCIEYGNIITTSIQDNITTQSNNGSFSVYWAGDSGLNYNGLLFY